MGSMDLPVTWPLRYINEEGDQEWLPDPAHVEMNVEFVRDSDPPYACFDSSGHPVRLVAEALELLLCRRVTSTSWRDAIGFYSDLECQVLEEHVDRLPHRVLSAGARSTPLRRLQPGILQCWPRCFPQAR